MTGLRQPVRQVGWPELLRVATLNNRRRHVLRLAVREALERAQCQLRLRRGITMTPLRVAALELADVGQLHNVEDALVDDGKPSRAVLEGCGLHHEVDGSGVNRNIAGANRPGLSWNSRSRIQDISDTGFQPDKMQCLVKRIQGSRSEGNSKRLRDARRRRKWRSSRHEHPMALELGGHIISA